MTVKPFPDPYPDRRGWLELVLGRNMSNTTVDIVLENLKQHLKGMFLFTLYEKNQMEFLNEELEFLRDFIKDSEENHHYEHAQVKDLMNRITNVTREAENIVDSLVLSKFKRTNKSVTQRITQFFFSPPYHRMLRLCREEIKLITKEVKRIYSNKLYGFGEVGGMSSRSARAPLPNPILGEEIMVGFDDQIEMIKEQLTGVSRQLKVISIIGMAGLGKTTLTRKLFNDPFIMYHFHVRGWTYVSQVYEKKDLLLQILSSIVDHKDEISTISDQKLGEELYKRLKCKRYLIVMDDLWNVEAWDEIKEFFPDDCNGSGVLFTSRLQNVAFHAEPDAYHHFLRFLTHDESWDLLQQKVFHKQTCPSELMEIGMEITRKCHGLPLAIVVVAGLLGKTDKTQDWWKKVAENMSSYIVSDSNHCCEMLEMSYNHLPRHLKPCFIYFGTFPEDYEIPMVKLIWLWIAEGFIQQIGEMTSEDVAEEYLRDLIERSLVLVAKRRCTGEIKSCRVHDVLRDFCLNKAKEENFLQHINKHGETVAAASLSPPYFPFRPIRKPFYQRIHSYLFTLSCDLCLKKDKKENFLLPINGYEQPRLCAHFSFSSSSASSSSSSSLSNPISYMQRCLCIHSCVFNNISSKPSSPYIRSILCFASEWNPLPLRNMSFNYRVFRGLRVLDLLAINIYTFPTEILQLVLLRYLALRAKRMSFVESIFRLANLETLVLKDGIGMEIPIYNILMMTKLRHLSIAGENDIGNPSEDKILGRWTSNLQTMSQVCPSTYCEQLLEFSPYLRKLGLCGNFMKPGFFWFPALDFLSHLESLKLLNRNYSSFPRFGVGYDLKKVHFPSNLKRLTLSFTYVDWKEMSSTLGMLPNLEALKLEYQACVGPRWETCDGEFPQLKYLKLYYMNIEEWNVSSTHFPRLQSLVLHKCEKLKEIPSELGDISTLQTIDVSWCSHSTAVSAMQIREEQQSIGNDWLRIFINPPVWNFTTDS